MDPIENWTFDGVLDHLVEFVTKHRIALYDIEFHNEPPLTPFLISSKGIFPVHTGDTITKEWLRPTVNDTSHYSPYDFDLIEPDGTDVIDVDMRPIFSPTGVPMRQGKCV